jgi:2-polyprenyl-3-methyl-5-hydroxy-6-metoxy-1,4-benzoquinol methylase
MKNDTDLAWERWGRQDPYYGVLADEKYRKENIGNTSEDFFESGHLHLSNVLQEIEKHFGPVPKTSALDFGCGVGRVLIPLSKEFNNVTGIDVSKPMLDEAARNLAERTIGNVDLLESDDDLSKLGDKRFDFIHTYIVLQHISPERGYVIIRNLLHHLSPVGAFFVHVLCRRNLPFAKELAYFGKSNFPGGHILLNILKGRRMFEPKMEMNEYDLGRLLGVLQQFGFQELMTKLEIHNDCLTASFYSKNTQKCVRANDGTAWSAGSEPDL